MLIKKSIQESLDLIIAEKISAEAFAKHYQISRSWTFELLRRRRNNENLERNKGHKKRIFSNRQIEEIRRMYKELMLVNGKMPSMLVLKTCMNLLDAKFPIASIETYRNIVKDLIEYPTERKKKTYRKRFQAPAVGFLVQGDVTTHAWLDNAYPFPLLLFIDDKSRYVIYADFIDSDNIENHKTACKTWLMNFGKPAIVYYDNDPKYAKGGHIRLILEKIGIKVINTKPYKPQGKGKLERKNGVFQDQLVHYLKYHKSDTIEKAREILNWYVDIHNATRNRELSDTPENVFKNSENVFVPIYQKEWDEIELNFVRAEKRKVSQINEIQIAGKYLSVPVLDQVPLSGRSVDIYFRDQSWIKVYYKSRLVTQYRWEDVYD